jgi:glyoxylase-like metal-dependent hydrolase (beta-lactamase superfamily II)
MEHQIRLAPEDRADDPQQDKIRDDGTHEVLPDLAYKRLTMVNVAFYGLADADEGDGSWVLIDAGIPGAAGQIESAAEERFGVGIRPAAIILTHGHIDHVGALENLAEKWNVPIYAHPLELPYLNGTAAYPPPDTHVGNGVMPLMAGLFPRGPFNFSRWLHPLPADGTVPEMPGWQWLPTPGHTPGHVSLWRAADKTVIAGDAFITTNQESAYAVATQREELHGPPMYFTPDWRSARESVERLATLEPEIAVTGHGRAMRGEHMRQALHTLARDFDRIAVPEQGRYVLEPARAEDGSAYVTSR